MKTNQDAVETKRSRAGAGAPWRCGWCSADRAGRRITIVRPNETTGICRACRATRRALGFRESGATFVVWDEDARSARRWADELRAAVASVAPGRAWEPCS